MKKLTICLLWSVISAPALSDSCQEASTQVAQSYQSEIDEIIHDYNASLQNLTNQYLTVQADPDVTFQMIVEIWQAHHDFQRKHEYYVNERPETFRTAYQSEKWKKFCDNNDSLESIAEANAENYEKLTDEIIESLEKRIELESIDSDEGLAAIAAYSHGVAPLITLKGESLLDGLVRIGPLFNSQHFELMKLREGKYNWDRVKLGWMYNKSNTTPSYTFFDFADEDLSFVVKPGRLNFTGVFEFDRQGKRAGADLLDRPAILLQSLEQQYPYLLKRFAWHNALAPDDPFLEFYYNERYGKESAE